ncbi:MAG: BLUF domain-containing protein [Psychroflexus sp.]|nr:BLUF domain-containing protein [Psychroflexus sp.]
MKLAYVSYMSHQSRLMSDKDLEQLLFQIREKNKRLAITGLLLLIQGKFVQYIEGPEPEIKNVYKSIKADPRHNELLLLDSGKIEQRQFQDWSMAYKKVKDSTVRDLTGYKDLELDKLFLNPDKTANHPVLNVLYNFTSMLAS